MSPTLLLHQALRREHALCTLLTKLTTLLCYLVVLSYTALVAYAFYAALTLNSSFGPSLGSLAWLTPPFLAVFVLTLFLRHRDDTFILAREVHSDSSRPYTYSPHCLTHVARALARGHLDSLPLSLLSPLALAANTSLARGLTPAQAEVFATLLPESPDSSLADLLFAASSLA